MIKLLVLYACALACVSSCYGNAVPLKDENTLLPLCGGYMFVDDEVVIDGPFNQDCILQFETQEDRILAFSVLDGDIKDALQFLNIHDGFGIDSPILKVENQIVHKVSRKDRPTILYTKNSEAIVRFTKTPAASESNFQLKIQKAVDCPLGIGDNTQCGPVVDDVSCHCAVFNTKSFTDMTMYCLDYKMKLIIFENRTEEEIVQKTWGTQYAYWTSLTDARRDGTWVWESTMSVLSAGNYTNWFPGRPSRVANNVDDCMLYGGATYLNFWGDINCATLARGICEVKP